MKSQLTGSGHLRFCALFLLEKCARNLRAGTDWHRVYRAASDPGAGMKACTEPPTRTAPLGPLQQMRLN